MYLPTTNTLAFSTDGTERARIDASGRVGIGVTPESKLDINGSIQLRDPLSAGPFGVLSITNGTYDGGTNVINAINSTNLELRAAGPSHIVKFTTGSTERARITAGGYFKASNTGTYANATGAFHEMRNSADASALSIANTNGSFGNEVLALRTSRAAGTGCWYLYARANDVANFEVFNNGNVGNANNSYGSFSDVKLKQDITDASSAWNDLKDTRFRKYRLKSDVAQMGEDAPYQLGVIADEQELVTPGLVFATPDREEVEVEQEDGTIGTAWHLTGTTTKNVKYSVLYLKAAVALQEAMARIESLEARLNALEN
jgi:hypothetical protein